MAIDIEWQAKPALQQGDGDKPKLFPRKANVAVADENLLAKKLAAHSGISTGVALAVLEDMGEIMGELLREGKDINISSLGRFSLSEKYKNRLARSRQMLGSRATARLCACRGEADNADGGLSTV